MGGCALCSTAAGPSETSPVVVFEDRHWTVTVFPGFDVPGWYFLQSRAHVSSLSDLPFEALQAFGPALSASVEAIRRATGCEKVYLYRFGETYEHWHVLVAARPEGIPAQLHGPRFFDARDSFRDRPRAELVAHRVADELQQIIKLSSGARS